MSIEFQMQLQAVKDFLSFAIANNFPLLTDPVTFPEGSSYITGFTLDDISAATEMNGPQQTLVDSAGNPVGSIQKQRPLFQVLMTLTYATISDLKAGNFAGPNTTHSTPFGFNFVLDAGIGPNGVPFIQPVLLSTLADSLLTPMQKQQLSAAVSSAQIPIDLKSALAGSSLISFPKFLNAGVAVVGGGDIAVRFEFEPAVTQTWIDFYNGLAPSQLADGQWALQIPSQLLTSPIQSKLKNGLSNRSDFKLTIDPVVSWSAFSAVPLSSFLPQSLFPFPLPTTNHFDMPRVIATFSGQVINACPGVDLTVDLVITVTMTLPRDNDLVVKIHIDYTKDPGGVADCVLEAAFAWPLTGFAMVLDGDIPWGTYFGGIFMDFPVRFFAALGKIESDSNLDNANLAASLPPDVIKLSNTDYVTNFDFSQISNVLPGLTVTRLLGTNEGLVIGGALTSQPVTQATLSTALDHGFSDWTDKTPCNEPNWTNDAQINIFAGNGQNTIRPKFQVVKPTVLGPLGQQVSTDPLDRYDSLRITFPQYPIHNPNGEIRVRLDGIDYDFQNKSYPCQLLLLSTIGARWMAIDPPPPLQEPAPGSPEAIAKLVWRGTHCEILSSVWGQIGRFNPKWNGDPPPPGLSGAREWIFEFGGLTEGDRVGVFKAGTRVAEGVATGATAFSMSFFDLGAPGTISLALNDAAPISDKHFHREIEALRGRAGATKRTLGMRQIQWICTAELPVEGGFRVIHPCAESEGPGFAIVSSHGMATYKLEASGTAVHSQTALLGRAPNMTSPSEGVRFDRYMVRFEPAIGKVRVYQQAGTSEGLSGSHSMPRLAADGERELSSQSVSS